MQTEYCYSYISTLADWDPVKTIFLCPDSHYCATADDAKKYAEQSGWQAVAEANKCLLIIPLAPDGWECLSPDHLMDIYNQMKNGIKAPQCKAIWGRGGTVWCWEIILFGAGYGDGAQYLSRVQVAHPDFFAAVSLVGNAAQDFSDGDKLSSHWLVPKASEDFSVRNKDVPVHTWIFSSEVSKTAAFTEYLNEVNKTDTCNEEVTDGLANTCWLNSKKPAHQVRLFETENVTAQYILKNCFSHVVRWKNSPTGTLACVPSREEFYQNPANVRRTVGLHGNSYDFFMHFPAGKTAEDVKGLPLVISLHGRGEPVWMYSNKNGWEDLADETGEFVTLCPDSPGNIWFRERDAQIIPQMVAQAVEEFKLDSTRVYLTGFSNGGTMTRELSILYPNLFAAVSPWNGPGMDTEAMLEKDTSRLPNCILENLQSRIDTFLEEKWQMPVYMHYGDRDMGIGLDSNLLLPVYLAANGCTNAKNDSPVGYTPDSEVIGQEARERFHTYRFGQPPMVVLTVMKNMPHGAITEQSRAVWEFLRSFRRLEGSKNVEILEQE